MNAKTLADELSSDSGSDIDMEKDAVSSKILPSGYHSDSDEGEKQPERDAPATAGIDRVCF